MLYDNAVACRYGHEKAVFGVRSCNSMICDRCHVGRRNMLANVLMADFRTRSSDWFEKLHFVVLRPSRQVQDLTFDDGLLLTVAIHNQFHRLLRQRVDYSYFSVLDDTAWNEHLKCFTYSLHAHAFIWGQMTKRLVRDTYVQAHRDVLGKTTLDDESTVTVYFEPCFSPFKAALYVVKHGAEYSHLATAMRSVDLEVHKNPSTNYVVFL